MSDPIVIDAVEHGLGRLATEYSESANLRAYLTALLTEMNTLEQVVNDLALKRTIDEAFGKTLDQIGELVGQPRIVLSVANNPLFGFWDGVTPNEYLGFGADSDPTIGGPFWGEGDAGVGRSLSDDEYRTYIRARIVRNGSKGTGVDMLTAFQFILGVGVEVDIQDAIPGNITIGISRSINDAEQYLLASSGLTPKPAAVGVQLWYTYVKAKAAGLCGDGDYAPLVNDPSYPTQTSNWYSLNIWNTTAGGSPTGTLRLGDDTVATPTAGPRTRWTPSTALAAVDQWITPSYYDNGYIYQALVSGGGNGVSGLTEPKWTTDGSVVYDVEGVPDWLPSTTYATNYRIRPSNSAVDRMYKVTAGGGGASGTTPPVWPSTSGATVTDGALTWTAVDVIYYTATLDTDQGGILADDFS